MSRRAAIRAACIGGALAIPGVRAVLRAASHASDDLSETERRAMAAVAESFRQRFDAPGLSIAIARHGRLAYAAAFGTVGHDSPEPVTTASLFRIASVTKPITSAAIFSLVEARKLRLSDTVFGAYGILGTRYGRQPYASNIEQITVDHLLTHSAGGWGHDHDPMFSDPSLDQSEIISRALDTQPPLNAPGAVFAYSNFGYCLLGRVIDTVSGMPYAEYVQKTILSRCEITGMRIARSSARDRAPGEVAYFGQDVPYFDPYALNMTRMDSHGGWIATPTDLVRFATHVDGFDAARNILGRDTIGRMVSPSAANPGYARGWNVNARGNWWHVGDIAGTTAVLVRTAGGFCWAALTNTRAAGSPAALDDMMWEMTSKVSSWKP
ncbi:MAG TPA: serine hydrolase domain-containing protein [Gemmatimonadaceae bacterium]|jgi:CubicO group peptidase (beta-lactamase class C family)